MTIGYHIRQLLDEGQKVILPGFGNLEIKDPGKKFPASGTKISPPGKSVIFDSSFSKDDGLLAGRLSEKEGIDQEEAGQQVLELVDAIKFDLDKGEPFELLDAGTFTRDEDSRIRFEPDKDWVLEPDQFGLESMDLIQLEDEDTETEEEKKAEIPEAAPEEAAPEEAVPDEAVPDEAASEEQPEKETLEKAEKEDAGEAPKEQAPEEQAPEEQAPGEQAPEEQAPEEQAPEEAQKKEEAEPEPVGNYIPPPASPVAGADDKNKKGGFRAWKVIWIIAGALIVVLVVLLAIPSERLDQWMDLLKKEQPEAVREQETSVDRDEALQPSETDTSQATVPPDEKAAGTEPGTGQEQEIPSDVPEVQNKYFIIAGSFRHLGNASEMQDRLKARGYDAGIMITEDRKYRVSIAAFENQDDAERELSRLKAGGMEVWLLCNE